MRERALFLGFLVVALIGCAIACRDLYGQPGVGRPTQVITSIEHERRGLLGLRRRSVYHFSSIAPAAATTPRPSYSTKPATQNIPQGAGSSIYATGSRYVCNGPTCQIMPATPRYTRTPQPTPAIDYRKLIEAISRDPRFRGARGEPGPAGRDAAITQSDRDLIAAALYERLAADFDVRAIPMSELVDKVVEQISTSHEAGVEQSRIDAIEHRLGVLEKAKISIEQYESDGSLAGEQSRRLLDDKPFYFGRRPSK